ncbi:hypothetical protein C8A05DRAFT_36012 [Staphylotrichum tortipilum]|uniref:Conidiation-specific protein 13 n=1 Tax=Staphylotrichum tortipilum TaxID=2831512 RepID=A0AAN6MGE0_9PEZI|nr:hypothetical protein C8A05DRAFT_36012 [Staphylotrichum longicolle]
MKRLLALALAAAHAPGTLARLHRRDANSNDPYPYCSKSTNADCIADGKYLTPQLDFSIPGDAGDLAFDQYLPAQEFAIARWPSGRMPTPCHKWAVTEDKWDAADFIVYNVTFSDCADTPWVMCHHNLAPKNVSYLATLSSAGLIVGRSEAYFATALIHEVTHAADSNLFSPDMPSPPLANYQATPFSNTSKWRDAVDADGFAISAYGAGSYVENFGETGRAVLLDRIIPGGLSGWVGAKGRDLGKVKRQLAVFAEVSKGVYQVGGKCDAKKKFPFPEVMEVKGVGTGQPNGGTGTEGSTTGGNTGGGDGKKSGARGSEGLVSKWMGMGCAVVAIVVGTGLL